METNVIIKCICYATYGYVIYACDYVADRLLALEQVGGARPADQRIDGPRR
jgi:hypothetical protein